MTLDQMRYFLEVAYCKSFSIAAKNLYISQPNLTRYIAAMEKELGTKLFERTTRRVELTEYGEQLMSKGELLFVPFLRSYQELCSDISSDKHAISIGVSRDERIPEQILTALRHRNLEGENYRYVIINDSPFALSTGLQNQTYSLIISSDRNARALVGTEHINIQPLQMKLAISVHHPKANIPGLSISDLRDEPFFFPTPKGSVSDNEMLQSIYRQLGTLISVRFLDSPAAVLNCVRICAGVAITPDIVSTELYSDIRFLPFQDSRPRPAYQSLVWRSDEKDPAVLELIDDLRKGFPTDV